MRRLTVTVNGKRQRAEVEDRTLLVDLLRDHLGLTGTHQGCDTSQCGACTVLLDGKAVKSCAVFAAQVDGRRVTTVEGLAGDGPLSAVQQALHEEHGLQCGFCTPGVLLTLSDVLSRGGELTPETARDALSGNMCRCTGYQNIVNAAVAAVRIEVEGTQAP